MPPKTGEPIRLPHLDNATKCLVQIAAAIAGANEADTRSAMEQCVAMGDPVGVEEVILQSYLFAGFPRTLNAARIWRAVSGRAAPDTDSSAERANGENWVRMGEKTCHTVYGESYEMLRENISALHPALDAWMIADGYGKVLSRPGLDLKTRELCILAACAASGQQRQLHSHLHGALNCGATPGEVSETFDALSALVDKTELSRYRALLARVLSRRHPPPPAEA